jgi:ABC-type transport system substrate-binding protein
MTRRLTILLVAAIAGGAFVTGCGSSSNTSNSTPATTSAGTPSTSHGSTTPASGAAAHSPAAQAAVAACKQSLQSQPMLSASVKTKLADICQKAANGDATAVKQATQQVCEEIIKSSNIPAGPTHDQAVAACKTK